MEFDELSRRVIGCALEVHRTLGPGLLESTYRQCLACELSHAQIPFQMEVPLPVRYKDVLLDCSYRIDLLVSAISSWRSSPLKRFCQSTKCESRLTCG